MKRSIATIFERYCSRLVPKVYAYLVHKGIYAESRWKEIRGFVYLEDNHPDRRFFVELVRHTNVESVLEIGAGSQYELRVLKEEGDLSNLSYTVLDINDHWLAEGKKITPEAAFSKGSINRIPYPNEKFEIVYCRHLIEHQPYYETAIKEMFRVSHDWIIINCFRWSTVEDTIRRDRYYSNTYLVSDLLKYCRTLSKNLSCFVILKSGRATLGGFSCNTQQPGVRRTGDHLIILMRKSSSITENLISDVAHVANATVIFDQY